MTYGVSIDWLALYVKFDDGELLEYNSAKMGFDAHRAWGYKKASHGTRQFATLYDIYLDAEPFAEVQCCPCSGILETGTGIIRLKNRVLYSSIMWYNLQCFLDEHHVHVLSISRVDLCADMNNFRDYDCRQFVADFLAERLRHKGKGIGAAYFDHYAKKEGAFSKAVLKYTGLSFGARTSGVRVYLYNKTFELRTVKDKPYIRDFWKIAGLDTTKDVWRLEVSITSQGRTFKDKDTGDVHEINTERLKQGGDLLKLFHTYAAKYFAFVHNREGITNISREPIIQLFDENGCYSHSVLRNVSCSNRTERILIRQLWQLAETYRGSGLLHDIDITKTLAEDVAKSCDLGGWLKDKVPLWDKPSLK